MPAPVPLSDRGREPLTRLVAAAQREAHAHIPLTPSLRVPRCHRCQSCDWAEL